MSCALTQNYILDCKEGMGGIKSVRFAEFANVSSVTESAGVVSAITMAGSNKFWKYDLIRETSSLTENINANVQNGTTFYQQELTIILNKMAVATRNEILLLAKNRLMAIVEDTNGTFWLVGQLNATDLTAGSAGTGTASGDRNGYTLTFTAMEKELAPKVDSSIIGALTHS